MTNLKYQVAKRVRGGWRTAILGLLLASCGETSPPENGSETHFLLQCVESCGEGFECLSGVCTRDCEADTDCKDLSGAAVCADAAEGCRVLCDADQDCTDENPDWECHDGQCRSGRPPIDAPRCPLFEGGVQEPAKRETNQAAVPATENTKQAVADDDGLFWRDDAGAVFARIDSERIELRPALEGANAGMGMITDDTTLYFADAGAPWTGPPEEPRDPLPPGRLYSVPKHGGPVELLLELEDAILKPLAVTEQGVVLLSGERLYLVSDTGAELLDHIPPIPVSYALQVADGRVYWSDWNSVRELTELYAVDLAGGEPEVVTEINGSFTVGHGRVLWEPETLIEDPLVLVNELLMLDLDTGCVTELPTLGETVGALVLDAQHIYWKSYNGLSASESDCDVVPLVRVNLTTGVLEELEIDGFDVTICSDFLAQDDDRIFTRTRAGEPLVAIDKP